MHQACQIHIQTLLRIDKQQLAAKNISESQHNEDDLQALDTEQLLLVLMANVATLKQNTATQRMKGMLQSYNMFDSSMYKDHKLMISIINEGQGGADAVENVAPIVW